MQGFTGFLGEETKKSTDTSNSFQKQLLTLETKRLEFEKEERERERQHEMRMMMQMFGNMIKQSTHPPQLGVHQNQYFKIRPEPDLTGTGKEIRPELPAGTGT
jgi:hypothetical protein